MAATKFLPEIRAAIVERIAAGASVPDAARAVGVHPATVKGWLTRGRREGDGPYADFARAVDDARRRRDELPPPLDDDEFQRLLDQAVRAGSVSAMKLWHERERDKREAAEDNDDDLGF